MSCMKPRDKPHFPFWSFSVAQFNNEQHNAPPIPGQAMPELSPSHVVLIRPLPFFFYGCLRSLPVFPHLSHTHTYTRAFTPWLGPKLASHLPVFSAPHNCNEPLSLFSPKNSPCTSGSRKTDLSPQSLRFLPGAPCPTSLTPTHCLCHAAPRCRCPGPTCPTRTRGSNHAWVPRQVCSPVCLSGHGAKAFLHC